MARDMSAPNPQEATRPSLLLRLRSANDSTAWSEFVDLYGAIIHDYCRRRGLQASDAAEVVQEVLIQVSRSIGSFDYQPARGKFRSWLATLARTKLASFLRRQQRRAERLSSFEQFEPQGGSDGVWDEAWCRQLAATALRRVAKRMAPDGFEAFRATWLDEESAASVAARFQQDLAWVYVAKSRGLRLMRESIIDLSDETLEDFHEQEESSSL